SYYERLKEMASIGDEDSPVGAARDTDVDERGSTAPTSHTPGKSRGCPTPSKADPKARMPQKAAGVGSSGSHMLSVDAFRPKGNGGALSSSLAADNLAALLRAGGNTSVDITVSKPIESVYHPGVSDVLAPVDRNGGPPMVVEVQMLGLWIVLEAHGGLRIVLEADGGPPMVVEAEGGPPMMVNSVFEGTRTQRHC
ncbi:hypothetical protein CYMTET_34358, partial [Cymbomonas tetramitiformis]